MTLVAPGHQWDMVNLFPTWDSPGLDNLLHTLASPGPDDTGTPPRPQSGPVDSGPYLGIIVTMILSYIHRPHLDLVTIVPPVPHLVEVTGSHKDLTWTW